MIARTRLLAAGIATLGLGFGASVGATESQAGPDGAGGLTITPPGLLVPAESPSRAPPAPSRERVRQLEQQTAQLTVERREQQEAVQQLRRRLAAAESASQWVPLFGTALGAMTIVAGWLGWQLHRVSTRRRRERELARLHRLVEAQNHAAAGAASAPVASTAALAEPAAPQRVDAPAAGSPRATAAMALGQPDAGAAAQRAVSVEEMLDLEQQAEFFLALGQDDAAIDLLMGHIRASGGASPMPYLKLLEIYRRRGDEHAFERTRARFNLRFNALAPAFDDDLDRGRDLEHCPEVLRRIQNVWANSLDALAEIESLLHRHDGAEPFDLPAYRELMLLAAVANDLHGPPGGSVTAVDLLLPLGEGAVEPSQTVRRALASRAGSAPQIPPQPMRHLSGQRESSRGGPTVDLDLSDFTPGPREFTRPAALADVEMHDDRRPGDPGGFEHPDPPLRKRSL